MKPSRKSVRFLLISLLTVLLVVGIVFGLPKILQLAVYVFRLFMPFILAYVFALLVNPLVKKMQKKLKLPRNASALIVIILLIGGVGGLLGYAGYKIVDEIRNVYTGLPEISKNIQLQSEMIKDKLFGVYTVLPKDIQLTMVNLEDNISKSIAQFINEHSMPAVSTAGNFAKALPKILVSTIVFLLSSFFIISDFDRVRSVMAKPFKDETKKKFSVLSGQTKMYLGGYVKAQLILMTIVFSILFIGLSILDVRYALLIALGTALLDALPFFGSGAVLWPWALFSFLGGNIKMGIGAIIIYIIIIITRQTLEPKLVSSKIGMNPIITLMSMYLGFKLFSVGGMIIGPLLMLFVISLYKAGLFEVPIEYSKKIRMFLKQNAEIFKQKFISFWKD